MGPRRTGACYVCNVGLTVPVEGPITAAASLGLAGFVDTTGRCGGGLAARSSPRRWCWWSGAGWRWCAATSTWPRGCCVMACAIRPRASSSAVPGDGQVRGDRAEIVALRQETDRLGAEHDGPEERSRPTLREERDGPPWARGLARTDEGLRRREAPPRPARELASRGPRRVALGVHVRLTRPIGIPRRVLRGRGPRGRASPPPWRPGEPRGRSAAPAMPPVPTRSTPSSA